MNTEHANRIEARIDVLRGCQNANRFATYDCFERDLQHASFPFGELPHYTIWCQQVNEKPLVLQCILPSPNGRGHLMPG